ncbi:hypothetical protein F5Y04DRAFT_206267 [Hypomontagnella monticulosa]|nr:hypothetical protein F5Y04DRAFT_206267 [Hypomontagnella monticulosa]
MLIWLFPMAGLGFALPTLEPNSIPIHISNFTAGCTPHSLFCSMAFNVRTTPGSLSAACSFWGPGPDRLPQIGLSGCSNSDVSFSFGGNQEYRELNVVSTLNQGRNLTGTRHIPASEFVVEDHGSVQTEKYIGPSSFPISNLTIVLL